eukprot:Em0001g3573a
MVRIVIRDLYVPLVDESDLLLAQLEAINHHITGLDIQNTGSPALFEELSKIGFRACGTVRSNRRGLSEVFKTKKLRRGDVYSEKVGKVLCLKWKDKRDVLLLSTIHDDVSMVDILRRSRTVAGGIERIQKPKVIDDYNQHMGGVDQSDQLVMYYGYAHRQTKWWKRVLFHLVDLSLVNASILYNSVNEKKLTQMEFRIEVAKGLLKGSPNTSPNTSPCPRTYHLRITERPFPERIPSDCPYGGRLLCEVCRVRGTSGHGHSTGTSIHVKECPFGTSSSSTGDDFPTLKNNQLALARSVFSGYTVLTIGTETQF